MTWDAGLREPERALPPPPALTLAGIGQVPRRRMMIDAGRAVLRYALSAYFAERAHSFASGSKPPQSV